MWQRPRPPSLMREVESSRGPKHVRLFAQHRAGLVRPQRTMTEECEESAVVLDIPGVAKYEPAGEQLDDDKPPVVDDERMVRAIRDWRRQWQYADVHVGQAGNRN